jgi:glycerate kinase
VSRVVAAPDKFRGSATAPAVAEAVAAAVLRSGGECTRLPLADGGEGTLDAFGGGNRTTTVTGPLGRPVRALWRLDGKSAVLEAAQACGLVLAGGPEHNDPVAATTRGVGELVAAAVAAGARSVLLGVGGSATTDGGDGAVAALSGTDLSGIDLQVCCDVTTRFTDAARVFGPQKGATGRQVEQLTARLAALRARYREQFGVDVDRIPGSGAAGGLAGGLLAVGGRLAPGFDTVADRCGLDAALAGASLVVTGEGRLDATSLAGKVVGGVLRRAAAMRVPVLVVAGTVEGGLPLPSGVAVVDLTERFGGDRSWGDPCGCVRAAVTEYLSSR